MPATYSLISSNTLSTTATSVSFTAIPASFTDLLIRASVRGSGAVQSETLRIVLNSTSGSGYSKTDLQWTGVAAASARASNGSSIFIGSFNGDSSTADTFTAFEGYLPNYTVNASKTMSFETAFESASATGGNWYGFLVSGLWRDNSTISSLTFSLPSGRDFKAGSNFYLYGIKNT